MTELTGQKSDIRNPNDDTTQFQRADQNGVHTFLVAFEVRAETRVDAEEWLHVNLPTSSVDLECYWVAEDDRRDGSACDSAVFVTAGRQAEARTLLDAQGLTGEPDYAEWALRAERQRCVHQRSQATSTRHADRDQEGL